MLTKTNNAFIIAYVSEQIHTEQASRKDVTLRDVDVSKWARVRAAASLNNTTISVFVVEAAATAADEVISQHQPAAALEAAEER